MRRASVAITLAASIAIATPARSQEVDQRLPVEIAGKWTNNEWGGPWALKGFDLAARTAVASLGRGGDSCGFSNVPAVIKRWDGRTLEIEVKTRNCRFPVLFRIDRNDRAWDGVVENDVRTVRATGREP